MLAPISTDIPLQNPLVLHHCGSLNITLYEVTRPPLTKARSWCILLPLLHGPRWEAEVTLFARDPSVTGRSQLSTSLTFRVDWKQTAWCSAISLVSSKKKIGLLHLFPPLFLFLYVRKHDYDGTFLSLNIENFDSEFSQMLNDNQILAWICTELILHFYYHSNFAKSTQKLTFIVHYVLTEVQFVSKLCWNLGWVSCMARSEQEA